MPFAKLDLFSILLLFFFSWFLWNFWLYSPRRPCQPYGPFKEHWAWVELCQLIICSWCDHSTILLSHSPARRAGAVLRSENIILYLFIPTWDKLKFGSQRWRHINSLQSFRIKMFIFYNSKDKLIINHFDFLQII